MSYKKWSQLHLHIGIVTIKIRQQAMFDYRINTIIHNTKQTKYSGVQAYGTFALYFAPGPLLVCYNPQLKSLLISQLVCHSKFPALF